MCSSKSFRTVAAFNAAFRVQLPTQPAHVTLYSLEKTVGIHINDDKHMESLERVDISDLTEPLSKVLKVT